MKRNILVVAIATTATPAFATERDRAVDKLLLDPGTAEILHPRERM